MHELFEDNATDIDSAQTLRISEIERNKQQPRKTFDEDSIDALAESILEHGVLQPVIVRPYGENYQLIAGERRFRAAKKAGLEEIPVIIKELTDIETMQIALIENVQREDLNPIEEAMGYKELSNLGMTQENIAKIAGKSRAHIANLVRLLALPNDVKMRLEDGSLSVGHAKVLLSLDNATLQSELAARACDDKMTVRQLEVQIAAIAKGPGDKKTISPKNTYYREVQYSLAEKLGRKVLIDFSKNKGKLTLEFYDEEDLNNLADLLQKYNEGKENA